MSDVYFGVGGDTDVDIDVDVSIEIDMDEETRERSTGYTCSVGTYFSEVAAETERVYHDVYPDAYTRLQNCNPSSLAVADIYLSTDLLSIHTNTTMTVVYNLNESGKVSDIEHTFPLARRFRYPFDQRAHFFPPGLF